MLRSDLSDLYLHRSVSDLAGHEQGWLFKLGLALEAQDANRSGIWRLDSELRLHRLSSEAETAYGACWADDGRRIAFLRNAGGHPQVFTLDLAGGEASQRGGFDQGVLSVEQWDGHSDRMLVLAHCGSRPGDAPCAIDHLPYKSDAIGLKGEQSTRLYQLDGDGRSKPLVDSGGEVMEARWSGDGKLAYVQRRDGRQRQAMDLWLKQGDGARRLTDRLSSISALRWSPDGRRLAFAANATEGSSMVFLHTLDIERGALTRCEIELASPAALHWLGEDELLVVQAHRGNHRIVRVCAEKPDAEPTPVFEHQSWQVLEMAAAGDRVAFVAAAAQAGPELWVCGVDGSAAQCVSQFNAWRCERPQARVERRRFVAPDGQGGEEPIDGWLLTPPGAGPFPLLLDMHGGPHSLVTFEHETHLHWPLLIERGWAILALNPVGTNSYGTAFAERLCGRWGELDLPQWLAAVAQLREQGVADRTLAVFGHSYGGFLAAWTLTRDVPLVCGVVSAGVANLESHYGTSDTGYYVGPYAMCAEPWQDRDLYRRLSPAAYAERVRAPTLLLQGDADQRCPIGQAEELFAQLVRAGKAQARMVLFPGGGHHVSSTGRPSHRLRFYREIVDWLEAHKLQRQDQANPDTTATRAARGEDDVRLATS